jgi:SpoVK/Ycf46/Vps4 family AAA+-type ATPase
MQKISFSTFLKKTNSKNKLTFDNLCPQVDFLCQKWILTALLDLGAHQKVFGRFHATANEFITYLKLELQVNEVNEYPEEAVIQALRIRQAELNAVKWSAPRNDVFYGNLINIKNHLHLNTNELNVLMFSCLLSKNPTLAEALNYLGDLSNNRLLYAMSAFLNINVYQLAKVLSPDATLHSSGLLQVDNSHDHCFTNKLDLLQGLSHSIVLSKLNIYDLFADNFVASPVATLNEENYQYLGNKLSYLTQYLANSIQERKCGVNILVYGPPGTGKTEFSRMLAQSLQVNLFEVAVESKRKNRISGVRRLKAYSLSQTILAQLENTMVVFDEMEDINQTTNDSSFDSRASATGGNKAWFNQMLEKNPVPTIWISNDINFLDDAHLRRFDYHLKMDIPPKEVRANMLQELTQDFSVSKTWCHEMADNQSLSPAIMTRAIKVVKGIQAQGQCTNPEVLLNDVIGGAMLAMNEPIKASKTLALDLQYGVDLVNTNYDMKQLLAQLQNVSEARICLFGPPGTGKTAFAKHVAKSLGKTALVKRASDIFGAYVGETERNMAMMFMQAREQNAVLILDEADSFFRSRQSAKQNWEIMAINEMLTQLESFNGIFFASTNLMDQLDEASLRRFDCKIKFDFLKPEQALQLIRQTCQLLNIQDLNPLFHLEHIQYLTAGDFATIVRQSRLNPIKTLAELVQRLKAEVSVKKQSQSSQPIGFLKMSA